MVGIDPRHSRIGVAVTMRVAAMVTVVSRTRSGFEFGLNLGYASCYDHAVQFGL